MLALAAILTLAAQQTVYVGTRAGDGIHRLQLDLSTGSLLDAQLVSTDPGDFLTIHRSRPLLLAASSTGEGQVAVYAIEPGGTLRPRNAVKGGATHVAVDRTGHWVASAGFAKGVVAVSSLLPDGSLSEPTAYVKHTGRGPHQRQEAPHAHGVYFSADNRWLYVPDLGLDQVKRYRFDATAGKLTEAKPLRTPPASGPRHLALGKRRVYVLNEIASTISVFERGKLLETVSSLPVGFTGESTAAEIAIDARERFLYASNRGADTIAVFRLGPHLAKVGEVKVGTTPRSFAFSPDGRFVVAAGQADGSIQSYRVNPKTGLLTAAGKPAAAVNPVSVVFQP